MYVCTNVQNHYMLNNLMFEDLENLEKQIFF